MKRTAFKLSFLLIISMGLQIFISEIWERFFVKDKPNVYESANGEHFDPSFSRLTSISDFAAFCDSVYGSERINASDSEQYAYIVSRTLRERFYHGYSYYRLGQNSIGYIVAPLFNRELRAIVLPDDILKHPNAACSQQSIVGMEVLKRKGFNVRKIGFFADGYGGHFCFEVYYNGQWHFFDPDMEPKLSIMAANHFPGIAALAKNDTLLRSLYFKLDKNYVEKLFVTYTYGPVNKFPAPNARIYQYITKYLSYTIWLWLALLYFAGGKILNYFKNKERCVESQDSLVPGIRA